MGQGVRWGAAAYRRRDARGLDQAIKMPDIGVTLPLREIYDGVEFLARPRIVADERPRAVRNSAGQRPLPNQ